MVLSTLSRRGPKNPPRRGERLAASAWRSGERPREIALANEWVGDASALWIELDAVAESVEAEALLFERCPGLTGEMLAEVRAPTRLSTHRSFEAGRIRLVSMCAMGSEPDSHDGAAAPALFVEPVKLLASSGWLITYAIRRR